MHEMKHRNYNTLYKRLSLVFEHDESCTNEALDNNYKALQTHIEMHEISREDLTECLLNVLHNLFWMAMLNTKYLYNILNDFPEIDCNKTFRETSIYGIAVANDENLGLFILQYYPSIKFTQHNLEMAVRYMRFRMITKLIHDHNIKPTIVLQRLSEQQTSEHWYKQPGALEMLDSLFAAGIVPATNTYDLHLVKMYNHWLNHKNKKISAIVRCLPAVLPYDISEDIAVKSLGIRSET